MSLSRLCWSGIIIGRYHCVNDEKKGRVIMEKNYDPMKICGIVMMVYGVLYALLGMMAIIGMVQGLMPGHEAGEIAIVALSYVIAILAIVCGYVCLRRYNDMAMKLGLVFALLGIVSLVYTQVSMESFSVIDFISMAIGVTIFYYARKDKLASEPSEPVAEAQPSEETAEAEPEAELEQENAEENVEENTENEENEKTE